MPKSASTIQSQISTCETNIAEALAQCAALVGNENFQFQFSLQTFVNTIVSTDIDDTLDNLEKVQKLFKECGKIMQLEKKRRSFKAELKKVMDDRERKETVKRITRSNAFNKQTSPLKIPSPPSSQEDTDMNWDIGILFCLIMSLGIWFYTII